MGNGYKIFGIIAIIIVIFSALLYNNKESFYGRTGMPSVPMDIPIPSKFFHPNKTYVDYSGVDFTKLCPSPPGKWCKTVEDCGPAELCVNSAGTIVFGPEYEQHQIQPQSNTCKCSIQNPCLIAGNIC